jgi:hypothetical protein
MLRFYKFSDEVAAPVPAREAYGRRMSGKGSPEECPPLRAANAFGWDVLAPFAMTFRRGEDGTWTILDPRELESDWVYTPPGAGGEEAGEEAGAPLVQANAWFWEKDATLPHRIAPEVFAQLRNQVKVSTYLFLGTDPGELLYMTDVPNRTRPYRALSVVLDTDWYPASYPWHCVLELDDSEREVTIEQGEPIVRLFLVRRDNYFAQEMSPAEFERFFERGQSWLARHGRPGSTDMLDITQTYVKQQRRSTFSVIV